MDYRNTFDGVESFCPLSVPGSAIVLVIRDLWGYSVAGCLVRCGFGRHENPSGLHFSINEGVVAPVDLLIVLGGHHLSVGVEVVPALGSSRRVAVLLQADPACPHEAVFFCPQIVGCSVDFRLSGCHMAGFIEIVPSGIKFHPLGDSGLSVLLKVVPEGIRCLRGVRIFLIL